jgi:hypothetical protein
MADKNHDDAEALDTEEIADAWAAVFIDIYEKLVANGELPTDENEHPNSGEPSCT